MNGIRRITIIMALCAPCIAFAQDPTTLQSSSEAASAEALAPEPTPVADTASEDTGTVIFFREKKFSGSVIRFKVREAGTELGKLSSGAYFTVQLPAGKHQFDVHSESKDSLTIEVEPNETYYVLGSISMGIVAGRPNLAPSDRATFERMQAELKDVTGQDIDGDSSER